MKINKAKEGNENSGFVSVLSNGPEGGWVLSEESTQAQDVGMLGELSSRQQKQRCPMPSIRAMVGGRCAFPCSL